MRTDTISEHAANPPPAQSLGPPETKPKKVPEKK